MAEVATVTDPDLAWLVDGIWVVEDLSVVSSGVAVTIDGAGYDAERGELWRTGDAGEAALLAARAERDRLGAAVERLQSEAAVLAEHAEQAEAEAARAAAGRAGGPWFAARRAAAGVGAVGGRAGSPPAGATRWPTSWRGPMRRAIWPNATWSWNGRSSPSWRAQRPPARRSWPSGESGRGRPTSATRPWS